MVKDRFTVIAVILFVFVLGMVIGKIASHERFEQKGAIAVSAGNMECNLITNPDKTTDWECKEVIK